MQHTEAARRLAELRTGLEDDLHAIVGSSPSMDGIGFGKRVGDGTAIAVERLAAVGAHDSVRAKLEEVQRAQSKLDDGTYGLCDVCGSPIPQARMEARPSATRCMLHPLPSRRGG